MFVVHTDTLTIGAFVDVDTAEEWMSAHPDLGVFTVDNCEDGDVL